MGFQVSTAVFEGPFDLLLHLITREQVDLWEVSLSSIVDAYVETLEAMQGNGLDLEVATEFVLIASVLLELKARRLLPGSGDVESEEELMLWEQRDLLLARLLECKTFKDAASVMSKMLETSERSLPRVAGLEPEFLGLTPDLLAGVDAAKLRDAALQALSPKPVPKVDLFHVAPITMSVSEAVVELVDLLPRLGQTTFASIRSRADTRLEVIVRFLALLELFKQGVVDLEQDGAFATLSITWTGGQSSIDLVDIQAEEYQG